MLLDPILKADLVGYPAIEARPAEPVEPAAAAAAACAEGGAMTPKEKAAAKRRALAQATPFEHISGEFSGIVFRNETQTRAGLVEVIVLDKRGGNYHTIGTAEVKEDGHVEFRGAYLLHPSEIRRP